MIPKAEEQATTNLETPTVDDEEGKCRQCGHPFNPHKIIAYDVEDFSKGGEMRCQVDGCPCFATVSFYFNTNAN